MNLDAQYQDEFSLPQDLAEKSAYSGTIHNINEAAYNIVTKKVSNSLETFEEIQIAVSNSGNKTAFTTIYNKLYAYSFFFARKFVSPEDAADVVASVFLKFWLLPDKQFENLSHIKAFFRVCVRNACLTHLRSEGNRIRKAEEWQDIMERENEENNEAFDQEINANKMQKVYDEIEKLPKKCKRVFKMCYIDNLKNRQIASMLRISENTVKNHKVYAIKLIRMALLSIISIPLLLGTL